MKAYSGAALRMSVYASLLAALTAVGAYIVIPVGPVPMVLQNMFVLLAGLLLGSRWGPASVALYLAMGLLGLPVFAGGGAGLGHLAGPTGGYLLGYLPAVFVVGLVSSARKPSMPLDLLAAVLGALIIYACGILWLMGITGMAPLPALSVGVLPFLLGDGVKIAVLLPAARAIRPLLRSSLGS